MANRFHGVAKGKTGVLWCRFRDQKGNSDLVSICFPGGSAAVTVALRTPPWLLSGEEYRLKPGQIKAVERRVRKWKPAPAPAKATTK